MSATETEPTIGAADPDLEVGAFADRLFEQCLAAFELLTVHLGRKLGFYDALVAHGPLTTADLAAATGVHERYAREWLEQQAVAGIAVVDDAAAPAEARRYVLGRAATEVITNEQSLAYVGPIGGFVASTASVLPELERAFRSGSGLSFGAYGDDLGHTQAAFNRPMFMQLLAGDWLANGAPDIDARLRSEGARVLDIGCGHGWSCVALAQAYPAAHIVGVDLDGASIEAARANAAAAGVTSRVDFVLADAADPHLSGEFDAVLVLEALHDMPRPVDVLRGARTACAPGGAVVVMDERVAEEFAAPGDVLERFMYSVSVLHCLAVGMDHPDAVGTGTVMRPSTLRRYAAEAGFSACAVLPIEHDLFRFYRLDP